MAAWAKDTHSDDGNPAERKYSWRSSFTSKNPDLYFRDGKRRIDFVLVYSKSDIKGHELRMSFLRGLAREMVEIEVEDCFGKLLGATSSRPPERPLKPSVAQMTSTAIVPVPVSLPAPIAAMRKALNKPDTSQGPPSSMDRYRIEAHGAEDLFTSDDLVFVKLHAPWHTMGRYAELFNFRKPLIIYPNFHMDVSGDIVKADHTPNPCSECCGAQSSRFPPITTGYTWPFTTQREYLFEIPPDRDEFFSEIERALVVDYILRRTHCISADEAEDEDNNDAPRFEAHAEELRSADANRSITSRAIKSRDLNVGITKLVSDRVFLAAYPLHEPTQKKEIISPVNNRIMLRRFWASYRSFARAQPLDYIRYYFGEAVAFYFAWIGFYTAWLTPVAVLGVLTFLLGLLGIPSDDVINYVCGKGANIIMCPLCSRPHCRYWNLGSSCFRQKLTHLVDNEGTVLFGVIMSLWAILFLEMWKRRQITLAFRWNVYTLEPVDQPARPEFLALLLKGHKGKLNPVSGNIEPQVPFWRKRVPFFIISYTTILFAIVLTLACLVGVILYKLAIKIVLYQQPNLFIQSTASMITTITGSVINLIFIYIMKMIYDRLAVKMTDLESHRTQLEYDNSLTLKLYMLQFVNYYSSVFYIAFIQGTTSALPGSKHMDVQSTGCDQGDCLFELFLQLLIIMVGKQVLNFAQEALMPVILRLFNRIKTKRMLNKRAAEVCAMEQANLKPDQEACKRLLACRADYNLLDPGSRPLFNEYLEMMIQFGFITMFVPAFPLAPFFGLLNNLFEIRGDARKFVCQYRRPVIDRVKTIGIWFSILLVLSSLAIRTNACIIAFTTQFIDRMVYQYHYRDQYSDFKNFTLSQMETSRFLVNTTERYCYYDDYREPPWVDKEMSRTLVYYHVLAVKFIFVFMFESIAILLTSIIAAIIPDTPKRIVTQIYHEANVTNQIILHAELQHQRGGADATRSRFPPARGLEDRVLKDVMTRMAEADEDKQMSTIMPVVGFYLYDEDQSNLSNPLPTAPAQPEEEPDEKVPLIGFRVPSS